MKKILNLALIVILLFTVTGCDGEQQQTGDIPLYNNSNHNKIVIENNKTLIVYFSRIGNTDFADDVDAITSASLLIKDDVLYGNTQYIASLIQQATGGELFAIQVEDQYPDNYDETVDRAEKENAENARPVLSSHIDNINDYQTVFIGFPNWWYDMPMALYSFFDEYDFSEKTIIPFVTSGASGFSDVISTMQDMEPEAKVLSNGFNITHTKAGDVVLQDIETWVEELNIDE